MKYGHLEIDIFGKELTEYILKHLNKESGGEIIKIEELIHISLCSYCQFDSL